MFIGSIDEKSPFVHTSVSLFDETLMDGIHSKMTYTLNRHEIIHLLGLCF